MSQHRCHCNRNSEPPHRLLHLQATPERHTPRHFRQHTRALTAGPRNTRSLVLLWFCARLKLPDSGADLRLVLQTGALASRKQYKVLCRSLRSMASTCESLYRLPLYRAPDSRGGHAGNTTSAQARHASTSAPQPRTSASDTAICTTPCSKVLMVTLLKSCTIQSAPASCI